MFDPTEINNFLAAFGVDLHVTAADHCRALRPGGPMDTSRIVFACKACKAIRTFTLRELAEETFLEQLRCKSCGHSRFDVMGIERIEQDSD